jgi:hypothetical protein
MCAHIAGGQLMRGNALGAVVRATAGSVALDVTLAIMSLRSLKGFVEFNCTIVHRECGL